MRKTKLTLTIIHALLLAFAAVIAVLYRIGDYTYMDKLAALWYITNGKFDTVFCTLFIALAVGAADIVLIIISAVKKVTAVIKKREYRVLKDIILWVVLLAAALLSAYLYVYAYAGRL